MTSGSVSGNWPFVHHLFGVLGREFWIESSDATE